ncbi:hypothetical protein T310_7381 [Rasamsonia emersonii CBS 393.64]|uniref:Methyltransferase n=1 Tax=Rasamsonia emersonii (strain ATCC 16479 / CBS 393.64 / IMI 116815) TaxID=1408163 RepID=A0A0F4YLE4_RASE3|nr:hypothetical protein T310_7381 [Rasamsonia emersonii CBS 393.64]KKA18661.1 hypothetical protein T310_7381 [Rasamsonia emersonii CBS 393.64]
MAGSAAESQPGAQNDHHAHPATIEVDAQATENDSSYGRELSTYTASLTSSALAYRHENGRRYHAYRDGTDEYPSAEVIGNDLSPIQPTMVPPNLRFLVDDIEAEWVDDGTPYDFIHARYLCYSIKDFKKLLKQCYKHTKPGGWVEFQDWDALARSEDGSMKGTALEKYYEACIPAFEKAGYPTRPGPHLEEWFREAGFVDIHVQKYRVPGGPWPKDQYYMANFQLPQKNIGTWMLLNLESAYRAAAMAVLTRFESWKPEEVEVLAAGALRDIKNPKIHALADFYVVYGRKPE